VDSVHNSSEFGETFSGEVHRVQVRLSVKILVELCGCRHIHSLDDIAGVSKHTFPRWSPRGESHVDRHVRLNQGPTIPQNGSNAPFCSCLELNPRRPCSCGLVEAVNVVW